MRMWPTRRLGDLTDILSGFAFDSEGFSDSDGLPLVRIRDVLPGITNTYFRGRFDPRYLVDSGDMLIGMDGEFNRARWRGGKALLNQRVCRISSSSEELDDSYLFHFLPLALKAIENVTPYVTVKHLSVKQIRDITMPLPPLPDQRRIAEILDKADALRAKRRAAIAHLDTLTQSIFLDMFGDPATNPKRWPKEPLGDSAVRFSDGPFGSYLKSSHYTDAGVRVVRLQNIGVGEFLDTDVAYISTDHFAKLRKHECLPGDVLVGTLGDPNLRACIQPAWLSVALNKADCVQIRPNAQRATAEFLCALLNQPATERMAQDLMHGQTRVRISMGRLRGLSVPMPPVSLQREFALRAAAVDRQKTLFRTSQSEMEVFFATLQQSAFRGELGA